MSVTPVEDSNFNEEVLEAKGLVLLDFWAPWCGPCRQLAPILDELSETFEGRIQFRSLNIDENPETAAKLQVRGIPTLKVFSNGEEIFSSIGVRPKSVLEESFSSLL